ncbi:MAG TPA: S41 family peptidase [Solirubrobacteraceae bacterium]|nr:S41 family peptidase [Solirubrobacteraceae bacterium]
MRRLRSVKPLPALLVPLVLATGIWLGGHPDYLPGFVRGPLVADSDGRLYEEALDVVADNYYRAVDRDKLVDTGLEATVDSLGDRFSHYFDPQAYKDFREATEGAFEGVGMNVEEVPRGLRVVSVFDGSPAQRGGVKAGDLITSVDGRSIAGRSTEEATTRIKGRAGTQVTLTVVSPGEEPRTVRLRRARVDVPVVEAEMRRSGGTKVAHVRLSSFTSGAHGEVRAAVDRLLERGAEGVVLDLRHNGGGLLNEAVLVSSIFIPEGTIVSTRGRSRPRRVFEATGTSIDSKIPVVVLVDRASASASEIVTGALQDRDRARVVGTRTFGKGVFQEIRRLSNGGALDITVGEYFTPDGRNLGGGGVRQGAGIRPDVTAVDDVKTRNRDEALDVAVDTVLAAAT